jgi:hypothetical protein
VLLGVLVLLLHRLLVLGLVFLALIVTHKILACTLMSPM